jgi:hypothetical protein
VASRSSAFRLDVFSKDARVLDVESFANRHGVGFFLHYGPLDGAKETSDLGDTLVQEYTDEAPEESYSPQTTFLAFPIRKKAGDKTDKAIWIGRGSHNDIVIPEASISTMHAFVRVDDGGKFFLQDMMSKNGTFVYNQRVPALGTGEPLPFASGDRVRFGTLKLTFLAAAEFINLVNQLSV